MDRTKEADDVAPRLPVAYSQGYVYVSVIHDAGLDAETSKGSEVTAETEKPSEQPKNVVPLGRPLAVVALAALFGPIIGAAVFVVLQNV